MPYVQEGPPVNASTGAYMDGIGMAYRQPLPQLNLKLLMEVWDWISFKAGHDGEPAWNQEDWVTDHFEYDSWMNEIKNGYAAADVDYCGTAYCAAGYALRDQMNSDNDLNSVIVNIWGQELHLADNVNRRWEEAGAHVLGLTSTESGALFSGGNTKGKVRRIMNNILRSRGEEIVL